MTRGPFAFAEAVEQSYQVAASFTDSDTLHRWMVRAMALRVGVSPAAPVRFSPGAEGHALDRRGASRGDVMICRGKCF